MRAALAILLFASTLVADAPKTPAAPKVVATKPIETKLVEAKPGQASGTVILRAMKDELERSRTLSIASLDQPYYIE
jgi:hypothetical protein